MRPRLARKIVARVQAGQVRFSSYSRTEVEAAFKMEGVALTEEHLKPWTDRATEVQRKIKLAAEYAPLAEAKRRAKDARIVARAKAADEEREKIRLLEAEKAQHQVAVLAGREAFKQAMEQGVDELPESVRLETGVPKLDEALKGGLPLGSITSGLDMATTPDYDAMKVGELKALAKERGLHGYSSMKKPDLIALLTTGQ